MKKSLLKKIILCTLIITFVILLQVISFASNANIQLIKKENNEYIIYVSEMLNKEFKFAFSNNNAEDKSNLEFKNSAVDASEGGNNIAYIDTTLYDKYFKDKDATYMWVKQGDEYKLEAERVEISEALTEDDIQDFNSVTEVIKVSVDEKELPTENQNGVEVNHKIGILKIDDDKKAKYSYKMVEVAENTDESKLVELANKMNEISDKDLFEQLSVYSEFKELYKSLRPSEDDTKWADVENYVIEQPQDSKTGDKYLVWIKKDLNGKSVIDLQVMTCKDSYKPLYENKEYVVKETNKLPVTGENMILFIIAGVILILIIEVVVLKIRNKKKVNENEK